MIIAFVPFRELAVFLHKTARISRNTKTSGTQRHSAALSGTQRHSAALSGTRLTFSIQNV